MCWSLPARGAWVEMQGIDTAYESMTRRSPHGERGLKWNEIADRIEAWISRSPHGERGLKSILCANSVCVMSSRSPHGERGLKSFTVLTLVNVFWSLPARGAWVEIR